MSADRFDPDSESTTLNRRVFEREFPRRRTATIEAERFQLEVQMLDESDGGVGVYSSQRVELVAGLFVSVYIDGQPARTAEVRYVHPHSHGGFHIGLKWS